MGMEALAIKYRPKTFADVTEQGSTKTILQQQLDSNGVKHAYLFVGSAGTGKTTCARIFANEINKGDGEPIELDAASNSGVDNVRDIIQQSKLKSLNSEYKVFIIDECHSLSNTAWQAFLKLLEEPPVKSIFIFCTTDPQKIPKTILSRVQRFDFQRISQAGILKRLQYICRKEAIEDVGSVQLEALEYIARIADGGMRTAITYLDKCLGYDSELTVDHVVKALGTADYIVMMDLTDAIRDYQCEGVIDLLEGIYADGVDLTQFIRQYVNFVLDTLKVLTTRTYAYSQLPETEEIQEFVQGYKGEDDQDTLKELLGALIRLNADIKYDSSPRYMVEASLLHFMWDRFGGVDGRTE